MNAIHMINCRICGHRRIIDGGWQKESRRRLQSSRDLSLGEIVARLDGRLFCQVCGCRNAELLTLPAHPAKNVERIEAILEHSIWLKDSEIQLLGRFLNEIRRAEPLTEGQAEMIRRIQAELTTRQRHTAIGR